MEPLQTSNTETSIAPISETLRCREASPDAEPQREVRVSGSAPPRVLPRL